MKMIYCISALLLFGCANATITSQEAARANFGTLRENWQTIVRGYYSMPGQLKDPYSAVYRFEKPRKGFAQDGALAGGKRHYGWIMPTWINAKNSFGGFTGYELHIAFLSNDGVSDITFAFNNGMAGFAQ
jgi:hypothetical protein